MLHGGEIYDKNIELDFSVNLNPYPCPDTVLGALNDALNNVNKYPDIWQKEFRIKVAHAENCFTKGADISMDNVIGGNGASELLFAITRFLNPSKVLLLAPCFYGYRHALLPLRDASIEEYHLKEEENFALTEEFAESIRDDTDIVVIANPNNPTGRCIDEEVLGKIVRKCIETDTALVVDECFLQLSKGGVSAIRYIHDLKKLFIVNAYTKLFAIPGVRVGYAVASKENIRELQRFLPEWNMSVFAQNAGAVCADILASCDFREKSVEYIQKEREKLIAGFSDLGYKVFPSDTAFFMLYSDENLYDFCLKRGILIRDCSNFTGLGSGYFRIAVRDADSNQKMLGTFGGYNCPKMGNI